MPFLIELTSLYSCLALRPCLRYVTEREPSRYLIFSTERTSDMVLQIDLITHCYASIFQKILKEGPLLKNCHSFKRWKLRYFLVRGQRLCFAHHPAVREYIHIYVYIIWHIYNLVNWVSEWVPGNVLWGDGPTGKDTLANIKVEVETFYSSFNLPFWAKDTFLSFPLPLYHPFHRFLN